MNYIRRESLENIFRSVSAASSILAVIHSIVRWHSQLVVRYPEKFVNSTPPGHWAEGCHHSEARFAIDQRS